MDRRRTRFSTQVLELELVLVLPVDDENAVGYTCHIGSDISNSLHAGPWHAVHCNEKKWDR
jgi:hypothetical protein